MAGKNDEKPNEAVIPKVARPLPEIPEESVSSGKAAVTTFTDRAQAFMIMDERDSRLIVDTLLGQFSKEYIYDIPFQTQYGKCNCSAAKGAHNHVRGLSVTGIREGCRLYGAIQCQVGRPQLVEEDGVQYYETWGEATDLRTGISEKKWYRVPLLKATKGGGSYADPYAYQICQSKAERNAKAVLLPQELIRAWLQDHKSGKKGLSPAPAQEYRDKQKKITSPPDLPGSETKAEETDEKDREQALGAIFEKLKGLGIPDKHQDLLLCKIAEWLGNDPAKTIKDVDLALMPEILTWLLKVKKKSVEEKSKFDDLYVEVIKGEGE